MSSATEIFVVDVKGDLAGLSQAGDAMAKSAVRSVGRQIGRGLVGGVLGSLFKR